MSKSSGDRGQSRRTNADPFAVFQPRRGRRVAIGLAVAVVSVFTFLAVFITPSRINDYQISDRLLIASIGWALALLFWRYASIKATPSREGLVVRNLFVTTTLAWPQIVAMQYGDGAPWPTLELNDTETIAVMAIQRSDGRRSIEEARRLNTLIKGLGEAVET